MYREVIKEVINRQIDNQNCFSKGDEILLSAGMTFSILVCFRVTLENVAIVGL